MSEEIIPESLDGERLDRVVAFILDISRNQAGNLIDEEKVFLGGELVSTRSRKVHTGETLKVIYSDEEDLSGPIPEKNIEIHVVYEDSALLVIDKQAGLVVHPGAGNETGTLVNGLLEQWPGLVNVGSVARPGIVHRLDRGTSGLLVVAKTQKAYESLSAQFSDRSTGRRYLALVWGQLGEESGSVDAPVGRSKKDRVRMAVVSSGKTARTNYQVDQRWLEPEVTLLKCKLETGRTHQIRVHLSAIGHPLVGDELYGGLRDSIELTRPFLHASFLEFDHPTEGTRISFESKLPSDLKQILDSLTSGFDAE
ncbi:MAG: Ribosomal large subunit pseudouridine synthase D [Acidimicrobiales bacterium AG-410-I20]|nr:MAG: Ribosomal large subunit pseudouridine synthase D [Acidimicrobiales bacterium AG-410-I20]